MEISTGTYNDIEAITGFQIAMASESEGTVLDSERVHNGVTAVMEDDSKGIYKASSEPCILKSSRWQMIRISLR